MVIHNHHYLHPDNSLSINQHTMKSITILLMCSLLFCSCFSTKKNKSIHTASIDSTNVSKTHKQGTSVTDSSKTVMQDSSFENSITVDIDTTTQDLFENSSDAAEKATDLAGVQVIKKPVHQVSINGNVISSSQRIKSVSIKENGKVKKYDATALHKRDSGQITGETVVQVQKEESSKEKQVERSGANPLIWIGLGAGVLLLVWLAMEMGFFTRKKKQVNDQLNQI